MQIIVGNKPISFYLNAVLQARPPSLTLIGAGNNASKAAWLALALRREQDYCQGPIALEGITLHTRHLAQLTLELNLESGSLGTGTPLTKE